MHLGNDYNCPPSQNEKRARRGAQPWEVGVTVPYCGKATRVVVGRRYRNDSWEGRRLGTKAGKEKDSEALDNRFKESAGGAQLRGDRDEGESQMDR